MLATVALIVVLRLWRADPSVPLSDQGDALFNSMLVKGLVENGWWTHNSALGFPGGQDLHDFAMGGDHLHIALMWLVGSLAGDAGVGFNLFFVAAVALSAATACAVLRWLGSDTRVAVAIAVLFALTPYAVLRGQGHITLAVYPVPIGAWLALATWRGVPLFARRGAHGHLRAWATRRTALTLAACAVIASAGSFYYAFFTCVLVAVAGAARAVNARRRRAALSAVAVCAILGVVSFVNLAPTTLYALQHGRNAAVAQRSAGESEVYAFKPAQLVMPIQDHRIGALARLQERYAATSVSPGPSESYQSTLGLLAALGLGWLLFVAVASAGDARSRIGERHRQLAASALVALLVGTLGGAGSVFAYVLTPQLRGWNRISVFLAFFALAAVALLLTSLAQRLRGRMASVGVPVVLGVVLVAGLLDQTTERFVPRYDEQQARFRVDERLVEGIEAKLPPGSAVLQLPPVLFPEGGSVREVDDYAPVRGYLHSEQLKWSYGAMKGRPEEWQGALAGRPVPALLASAVATGFAGLWVDRAGYADRGAALEKQLRSRVGQPLVTGEDGRVAFYPVTDYARRLRAAHGAAALRAAGEAALRPIRVSVPAAGVPRPPGTEQGVWDVPGRALYLALDHPGRRPVRALISLTLQRAAEGTPIDVSLPGRAVQRQTVGGAETRLDREATLAPGRNGVVVRIPDDHPVGDGITFRIGVGVSDRALLLEPPPIRRGAR